MMHGLVKEHHLGQGVGECFRAVPQMLVKAPMPCPPCFWPLGLQARPKMLPHQRMGVELVGRVLTLRRNQAKVRK